MKKYSKSEILQWFRNLSDELSFAKEHMLHAEALNAALRKHRRRLLDSPPIWRHSYWAHMDAALMRLCRVFDKTGLNIGALLISIKQHPDWLDKSCTRDEMLRHPLLKRSVHKVRDIDIKQLDVDIQAVSQANPLVGKLWKWRDKRLFHKTPEDIWQKDDFSERYPLLASDLDELVRIGFKILNRYSWHTIGKRSSVDGDLVDEYDRVFRALVNASIVKDDNA